MLGGIMHKAQEIDWGEYRIDITKKITRTGNLQTVVL